MILLQKVAAAADVKFATNFCRGVALRCKGFSIN